MDFMINTESNESPSPFKPTEFTLNESQQQLVISMVPKFKKDNLVKSLMIACGIHQKKFAYRHGFDPSDVSKVIRGVRKTSSIRKAIAQELGIPMSALWRDASYNDREQ